MCGNKNRKAFLIFISGHGYGHISRMRHVLKSLHKRSDGNPFLIIVSDSNPKFLMSFFLENTFQIPFSHDVGLIQKDSFTVDLKSTLRELSYLKRTHPALKENILKRVKDFEIIAVLSDTSPFAFSVAKALDVPSFFVGNFTWVDIYKDLSEIEPEFKEWTEYFEEQYMFADFCFTLPMNTMMAPFSEIKKIKIPFVAPNESTMSQKQWERITGRNINDERKKILLSFGGFDFNQLPVSCLKKYSSEYLFLTTKAKGAEAAENLIQVDSLCSDYQGLIKFCDAVITKPGYGIITDCLIHKKPIIYTDRGRFAEYEVLKGWLERNFPSIYLTREELLSGSWNDALGKIFNMKKEYPQVMVNGAEVIAEKMAGLINEKSDI